MINNLFVTYSYPLFVGGVLADSHLFLAAQALFLVWNSVNDPLFGWLSDHTQEQATTHGKKEHSSSKRLKHIKYAGYLLGGAFLFAWSAKRERAARGDISRSLLSSRSDVS